MKYAEEKIGDEEIREELNVALSAARAWMQVKPVNGKHHSGSLQVGEPALFVVKSTLPG